MITLKYNMKYQKIFFFNFPAVCMFKNINMKVVKKNIYIYISKVMK